MNAPDQLDHLRRLGAELQTVFLDERAAIGNLDHAALELLAARKRQLSDELARARTALAGAKSPELKALFEAIRIEAHANAILARTAHEAVCALMGIETQPAGYDRRANRTTTGRTARLLATY